jgi:hypothetical protein
MQTKLAHRMSALATAAVILTVLGTAWHTGRAQTQGEAQPPTAEAQEGDTLQVIVFAGGFNLPGQRRSRAFSRTKVSQSS